MTGVDQSRGDLVEVLRSLRTSCVKATVMPACDAQSLADAGFAADLPSILSARLDRGIRMASLVASSLSVDSAADRLDVSPARVRQWIDECRLWVFGLGGDRLLPSAQFTVTGVVPNLEKVMPQMSKGLHPLTVQALLTRPQPSLTDGGRPMSITAWLTACIGTDSEIKQVRDIIAAAEWESS